MLAALITILKPAFEASLLIAVILSLLTKINKEAKTSGVWTALIASAFIGFLVVYRYDFFGDREVFETYLLALAAIAGLGLGAWACWTWRGSSLGGAQPVLFITLTPLLTIKAVEVVLFPANIFIMNTGLINSELIFKITGVVLGLLTAVIFGWAFARASRNLKLPGHIVILLGILLVMLVRQVITLLQLLFVLGYLPATPWAVSIIAPVINNYYPGFFYLLLVLGGGALVMALKAIPDPRTLLLEGLNPAQKRKLFANIVLNKSWVKAATAVLTGVCILLGVNLAYANRQVKLSPPTPLQPKGDVIQIPLETVSDGKLHRFSYVTPENITMRFIVIKKSEKSYGVGLDACDICGVAGYYQRGKNVICKNCDVIINIPTIGFPGGCNPIPLTNKVEGKHLVIETKDLDAKEEVFR